VKRSNSDTDCRVTLYPSVFWYDDYNSSKNRQLTARTCKQQRLQVETKAVVYKFSKQDTFFHC